MPSAECASASSASRRAPLRSAASACGPSPRSRSARPSSTCAGPKRRLEVGGALQILRRGDDLVVLLGRGEAEARARLRGAHARGADDRRGAARRHRHRDLVGRGGLRVVGVLEGLVALARARASSLSSPVCASEIVVGFGGGSAVGRGGAAVGAGGGAARERLHRRRRQRAPSGCGGRRRRRAPARRRAGPAPPHATAKRGRRERERRGTTPRRQCAS